MEYETLLGAKSTIVENKPKIAVAVYHTADAARLISDFLKGLNLGYKIGVRGIDMKAGAPVTLHAWV
jgi:hypothetical protein